MNKNYAIAENLYIYHHCFFFIGTFSNFRLAAKEIFSIKQKRRNTLLQLVFLHNAVCLTVILTSLQYLFVQPQEKPKKLINAWNEINLLICIVNSVT